MRHSRTTGLRTLLRALAATALWLGAAGAASAQGTIEWAEVQLALEADGSAEVTYQTRWRTDGSMHGFSFQGESAEPRFRGGTAELPDGSQVPLSITSVGGGRWDVVLADDRAWGPGEATYTFSYEADLAAAGMVAATTAGDGTELIVLDWGPVEWDSPLGHETLAVTLIPVLAPRAGDLSLDEAAAAGLRTEPWVNKRYLISYRGVGEPPAIWARFHQEQVPAGGNHRVQLYFPARFFPAVIPVSRAREGQLDAERERRAAMEAEEARALEIARRERAFGIPAVLALLAVFLLAAGVKLKGIARAHATAPDVLWERDDWEPPRLRLSSFRKTGKVAELSPIEALTLLGLPFQVILAMLLDLLAARALIRREAGAGALRTSPACSSSPAS